MPTSCVVVEISREGLAILRAALLEHARRLECLLRPSWPDTEEIGNEMYHLVDTLRTAGVDQKWFSWYARVEGGEAMLTVGVYIVMVGTKYRPYLSWTDYNLKAEVDPG
jgi:hypothetical protein